MFWTALIFAFASDFLSKSWIRANLALGESRPVLGDLLRFTHWSNSGAAFGIFQGATPYLAVVSVVCIVLAIAIFPKLQGYGAPVLLSLGLVAGGALGNFVDRVRFGGVTDFISLSFFTPIFNLADSAIVVGAVVLGAFFLLSPRGRAQP